MTTEKEDLHEIAGGWITERKNTPVPGFLKLSYVGFCLFGLVYLVSYWSGETGHATRGPLVEEANRIMQTPGGAFMGFLLAVLAVYVAGLLWYAFFAKEE
jgi:hypothetical protein